MALPNILSISLTYFYILDCFDFFAYEDKKLDYGNWQLWCYNSYNSATKMLVWYSDLS